MNTQQPDTLPSPRPFLNEMKAYVPGDQPEGAGIIKLNTNEFPYPAPAGVLEAIQNAATDAVRLYPNPTAQPLREALAARHGVKPEQILVGNGSDEVLRLLFHGFVGPGRTCAVVEPTYSLYPVLGAQFESRIETYPLLEGVHLPPELFKGNWDACFLPVPNPPLGTIFPNLALCELAEQRGLLVLDGAYLDFWPGYQPSVMVEDLPNVVVTRTFSKSFGLAGLRIGYAIGHPEVIRQLQKLRDSYNVNRISQAAALAALAESEYYESCCLRIINSREEMRPRLVDLGFKVHDSKANFLFARHAKATEIFRTLSERNIYVRHFDHDGLRDGLRITIGTEDENAALLKALSDLKSEGLY